VNSGIKPLRKSQNAVATSFNIIPTQATQKIRQRVSDPKQLCQLRYLWTLG